MKLVRAVGEKRRGDAIKPRRLETYTTEYTMTLCCVLCKSNLPSSVMKQRLSRKEGPNSHYSPSVVEDELVVGAELVHVRGGPSGRRVVRTGRAGVAEGGSQSGTFSIKTSTKWLQHRKWNNGPHKSARPIQPIILGLDTTIIDFSTVIIIGPAI